MRIVVLLGFVLFLSAVAFGRSPSLPEAPSGRTYTNPVFPGDHPDCTLTKVGKYYYTTGSSFSTSPTIYRSTDLVHWEPICHPVPNSWKGFEWTPTDGCWGGDLVYYENKYWDFFGHASKMYFVSAQRPEGPWSEPVEMNCPKSVPGLGMDNSIFIDGHKWYLLVKNGQSNNWILQLGPDGQPAGAIYNLCWLNPAPVHPYSWAEGPVMWKHDGYYYYCFAINVYAGQRIFRSRTLTSDSTSWQNLGDFFNGHSTERAMSSFPSPNHSSAVVPGPDSTWWILTPAYSTPQWQGQGRQGLLSQVTYNAEGKPVAQFPVNEPLAAPDLPGSGIPWMVPKADFFNSKTLSPAWQLLGYCPVLPYSLTKRPGWLYLMPVDKENTIVQSDAEHNYSLITRVDSDPKSSKDEAGLKVMTGLRTLAAKVYSSYENGRKVIVFSFNKTRYSVVNDIGDTLWLRLVRVDHDISGYYSANGFHWTEIGDTVNVASMDVQQPDYNAWTGNRQGLYIEGSPAYFDLYIYRDAYTPILAECPANQYGTWHNIYSHKMCPLDSIRDGSWVMYAGVEFGGKDYPKVPDSISVTAASGGEGGTVQVWLDGIGTGKEIGRCKVRPTGGWNRYETFTAPVRSVSGLHDVYLRFVGKGTARLFRMESFVFKAKEREDK